MEIKKVAIVGMGALGLMYADVIEKKKKGIVTFIMDENRLLSHKEDVYMINGEKVSFNMSTPNAAEKADLVIFATKYLGLKDSIELVRPVVSDKTILISVLNGIISEDIIKETYGDDNLLYCLGEGMDAMRDGTSLTYSRMGQLRIGAVKDSQVEAEKVLHEFFTRINMPHIVDKNIMHSLWGKFMLNVGVNQTCMVYEKNYGEVTSIPEYKNMMLSAMDEVIRLSELEGINLTLKDRDYYFGLLLTLKKDGYPSMRQDAVAKRKSEVDMFAGTVIELSKKHGIEAPVNQMYYDKIKEIEAKY